jgi:outer membrane lipoprotein-sorting protein
LNEKYLLALLLLFSFSIIHAQQKQDSTNKEISAVLKEIKDFNTKQRQKDSAANKPLGSRKEEDYLKQYQFYKKIDQKLKAIQ